MSSLELIRLMGACMVALALTTLRRRHLLTDLRGSSYFHTCFVDRDDSIVSMFSVLTAIGAGGPIIIASSVGSASGPDQVTTSCIPLEDSLAPQRCEPKFGSSSGPKSVAFREFIAAAP
eukprot:scaffold481_cov102-Skeletonema_dohrnii-CCMP3373.AAC.9